VRRGLLAACGAALRLVERRGGAGLSESSEAARIPASAGIVEGPLAHARPRILLIRPDHFGDLLLTSPAVELLRSALPEAHLALMVGPWAEEVAKRDPLLDELILCPFPGFTRTPKGSSLQPYRLLWETSRLLRERRYDAALVLRYDHWWGAWLAALAGIPVRVGWAVPECRPFLTHVMDIAAGSVAAGSVAAGSVAAGSVVAGSVVAGSVVAGSAGVSPARDTGGRDARAPGGSSWLAAADAHHHPRRQAPGKTHWTAQSLAVVRRLLEVWQKASESAPMLGQTDCDSWREPLAGSAGRWPARDTGGRAARAPSIGSPSATHQGQFDGAPGQLPLRFAISLEEEREADRLWAELGLTSETPAVALHPGTGSPLKLWPEERWVSLGTALAGSGMRVLVTGSSGEAELASRIVGAIPGAVSLAGATQFGTLAALFRRCRLVVGVDSGPLHLAVATDTPSVRLFGPTDQAVYGPWGDPSRHRVVVAEQVRPCSRLDITPPSGAVPPCMELITVEHVLDACEGVMH